MKKILLFSTILVIIISAFVMCGFSEPVFENFPPILDKKILPGFYIHESEKIVSKWNELDLGEGDYNYLRGIDLSKIKSPEIVSYYERWETISKEKTEEEIKKMDYTTLTIRRDQLKSHEAAMEWAKLELKRYLDKGSFSGVKIGDACWSNRWKMVEIQKNLRFTPVILFVQKNFVVRITITRMHGPVDPNFAEKVALTVASRL